MSGRQTGRRGEGGQALVLALLVLFLASTAGALVAADLGLELRLARESALRSQAAALVDGAVAEALARLAREPFYRGGGKRELAGGLLRYRVERRGPQGARVTAEAALGALRRRAVVEVETLPYRPPRVVRWSAEAGSGAGRLGGD